MFFAWQGGDSVKIRNVMFCKNTDGIVIAFVSIRWQTGIISFYEFKEQESLVHIRSQRQWTASRTQTIYSQGTTPGTTYSNVQGGTAY